MTDSSARPLRVAVLGGGLGSLTTAHELSKRGYDITVYQLGWRLGGQGASGRNVDMNHRIEEHGLHIWFGFYHNAFRMMREVYDAQGRPPGHPLATVEQAFIGTDTHLFLERIAGDTRRWRITFPHDDGFPGTSDSSLPDLHELLVRLVNFARDHFRELLERHLAAPPGVDQPPPTAESLLSTLVSDVTAAAHHVLSAGAGVMLALASTLAERLHDDSTLGQHLHRLLTAIAAHLSEAFNAPINDEVRRAWLVVDLALTYARGFIADDVLVSGLRPLDRDEFRDWLTRHGANHQAVQSAVVQAFYDASFSYADGRTDRPNVAAGVAIRATLRIIFGYRGHVVYKMAAGMGDAVFAPLYEVLKSRGVKFRFFHRVTALDPGPVPGASARGIARIHLSRQVDLVGADYHPLVTVKDLPCWPSTPLTDQIKDGDRLKGVDLESHWNGWPDVGTLTLEAGRDFDLVVLGISLGALPLICQGLLATGEPASRQWRALFDRVKTIRTQAVQLWSHRTSDSLGWGAPGGIIACCDEPDASWADFSHLLDREAWPASENVAGIYYGCGPMPDTDPPIPPPDRTDFPARALADASATADEFLHSSAAPCWPDAIGPDGLDPAAVASRYDRVNIDPSERYVLAVAGGESAKLPPGGSGYSNLFLTGSWVDNGLNISSVEGTVMAGLGAAAAITGSTIPIIGKGDL